MSFASSIFGGVVAAFSSYFTVWIEFGNIGHTFLWLPLSLFLGEKLLNKKEGKYILFIILSFFLAFLSGYIQGYFYTLGAFIFYMFLKSFLSKQLRFGRIIGLFLIIIFPLLLSGFQLFPLLRLFSESSRNGYSLAQIEKLLNPVFYWITVLVPNFFGHPAAKNTWFDGTYIERVSYFGVIPFTLAAAAISQIKKRREVLIFTLIALVSLVMSTNIPFMKYFYTVPIPLFSTTVPTRILSLFTFAGAILSAFGLEIFVKSLDQKQTKSKILIVGVLIFVVILIIFAITFFPTLVPASAAKIAQRNTIIPLILSVLTLIIFAATYFKKVVSEKMKSLLVGIIIFLTVAELLYFFHKITPFAPQAYFYPRTEIFNFLKEKGGINRFWGYGKGTIEGNIATVEGIYSPDGVDPLHIKRYGEFISTSQGGEIGHVGRAESYIAGGFGQDGIRNNPFRQRVLNIDGVKYVLQKVDSPAQGELADYITFPQNIYKMVFNSGLWQAYENKDVLPRIKLFSKYRVVSDQQTLSLLQNPTFDYKQILLLPKDLGNKNLVSDSSAKASLLEYSSNRVTVQTNSATTQLLFLSDVYDQGWTALIDSQNATIYPADYAFRAVLVPAGKHKVIFRYADPAFYKGLIVSLVSTIVLFAILIILKKKKYVF